MVYIDAFNGDADGICALQQLRLANPVDSQLVTGVKRDIQLLRRIDAAPGDQITVLDISLDKNRDSLTSILEQGAHVTYFDHHFAGDIPQHVNLAAHIDTSSDTCTSLLVNKYLRGQFAHWAVVGSFGDNFDDSARNASATLGLRESELLALRELGICINYNAYGATIEDLHFAPDGLFRSLHPYKNPLDFIARDETFNRLRDGYYNDLTKADQISAEFMSATHAVYLLPAAPWARRVSGVFANRLAQESPNRAHALLTRRDNGGFVVSVRAPLTTKSGADELCRQFPTGGGRKAAAGINDLPSDQLDAFVAAFRQAYP